MTRDSRAVRAWSVQSLRDMPVARWLCAQGQGSRGTWLRVCPRVGTHACLGVGVGGEAVGVQWGGVGLGRKLAAVWRWSGVSVGSCRLRGRGPPGGGRPAVAEQRPRGTAAPLWAWPSAPGLPLGRQEATPLLGQCPVRARRVSVHRPRVSVLALQVSIPVSVRARWVSLHAPSYQSVPRGCL